MRILRDMTLNFLLQKKGLSKEFWTWILLGSMGVFLFMSVVVGQIFSLYLAALFLSAIAIFIYPQSGIIAIFLFTMWFERFFTLQELVIDIHSYKLYPLDFLLIFSIFSVLIHLYAKKIHWKWHAFDWPILIFGGVVTAAFLRSLVSHSQFSLAFSTYKNYFLYAIVYFLVSVLFTTKKEWKFFMKWFAVGGVGLLFFLAYGLLSGSGLWSEFTPLSTYGSRLIAGTHIFYFVMFAFYLLAHHLWQERGYTEWKQVNYLLLLLSAVALVVSLVRHLWIAVAAIFVLWVFFLPKSKRYQLLHLAGYVVGSVFIFFIVYLWLHGLILGELPKWIAEQQYIVTQRLNIFSILQGHDTSFGWRTAMWSGALQTWWQQPLFGVGIGNVFSGFYEFTSFEIPVRDLHNNYLGMLLQLGILGVSSVVYWFFHILRQLSTLWKKMRGEDAFETRMLFTWGSIIVLFMIVFSISVYWDINLFIIWWWLALAAIRWILVSRNIVSK
jgi:O-antigen ligase